MFSYAVLGVMMLTVFGILPVSSMKTRCTAGLDIKVIQNKCKEYNDQLMAAEIHKDHNETCRQLILILKCVATNVTWCFDYFSDLNEFYFHSPYNCELTADQIRELQAIHNSQTEVQVVPLDQTTSTEKEETTPTSRATTAAPEDEQETEDSEDSAESTNRPTGNNRGSKEEQKGSNSDNKASSAVWSTTLLILLVLMSRSLSWRLVS